MGEKNEQRITRHRTGQMLQELFKVLSSKPDGVQAREAIDRVGSLLHLTDHEKGKYDECKRGRSELKAGGFLSPRCSPDTYHEVSTLPIARVNRGQTTVSYGRPLARLSISSAQIPLSASPQSARRQGR